MILFKGIVLNETNAKLKKMAPIKNIDVNINLNKMKVNEDIVTVDFSYKAIYVPDIGELTFNGVLNFKDEMEKIKEYEKEWKKSKSFPKDVMVALMNIINTTSSINGVLVSRAINLAPPIIPPKLEMKEKNNKSGTGKKK